MIKLIRRTVIVLLILSAALSVFALIKTSSLKDNNGPKIMMVEDTVTVDIDCTDEELLNGISALDEKDGDVADTLVVQDMSNFIEKGRRQVTVAAFDSDNNVTKATREVIYRDYTSPRFSLEEPLRFELDASYIPTSIFTVQDCLDGDLSGEVLITSDSSFSTGIAGEYAVTFQVSNSAGDVVELPLTVEYYDVSEDNTAPKVVLSDYLIYIKSGDQIDPMDYVSGIVEGGASWEMDDSSNPYSSEDIEVTNPVDSSVPGVYEISYKVLTEETYQPKIRLIVIVE